MTAATRLWPVPASGDGLRLEPLRTGTALSPGRANRFARPIDLSNLTNLGERCPKLPGGPGRLPRQLCLRAGRQHRYVGRVVPRCRRSRLRRSLYRRTGEGCACLAEQPGQIGDLCLSEMTCGRVISSRHRHHESPKAVHHAVLTRLWHLPDWSTWVMPGPQGSLSRNCTGPGTCGQDMRCADTPVGKSVTRLPVAGGGSSSRWPALLHQCGLGQLCPRRGVLHLDGGCSLCTPPDGANPSPQSQGRGSGNGGSGGCGCANGPASSLLIPALGLASRRRSCCGAGR